VKIKFLHGGAEKPQTRRARPAKIES
jgi:hypothetical protein